MSVDDKEQCCVSASFPDAGGFHDKILDCPSLRQDLLKQGTQSGNVPLFIAKAIDRACGERNESFSNTVARCGFGLPRNRGEPGLHSVSRFH